MHCSCGEVDHKGLRQAGVVVQSNVLVRGAVENKMLNEPHPCRLCCRDRRSRCPWLCRERDHKQSVILAMLKCERCSTDYMLYNTEKKSGLDIAINLSREGAMLVVTSIHVKLATETGEPGEILQVLPHLYASRSFLQAT